MKKCVADVYKVNKIGALLKETGVKFNIELRDARNTVTCHSLSI